MRSDGTSIRNEFTFDLDQGVVYNDTFEQSSPFGSPDDEAPYAEPKRIGGGEQPLSAYLHRPEGFVEPGHPEHWTSRATKTGRVKSTRPGPGEYIKDPYTMDYANMASGGDGKRTRREHDEIKKKKFAEMYNSPYRSVEKKSVAKAYYPKKKSRKVTTRGAPSAYESAVTDSYARSLLEGKGEDMAHGLTTLTTGTRVRTPDPAGQDKYAFGTVVELKAEAIPRGYALVAMDRPSPDYNDYPEVVGEMHGLVIKHGNLRSASGASRSKKDLYKGVPEHIGVFAHEPFEFEGRKFKRGAMGRVLEDRGANYTVDWYNVRDVESPFYVPKDCVRWCRFEPSSNKIKQTWYTTHTPLAPGDVLAYWSEKPNIMSGDRHHFAVTKGVLLRHDSWDESRCCINATIVSGMAKNEGLGMRLQVRKQDVRKFEETFLDQGQEVEIVAEVHFRKKNLQGRRGKVILATDFEGDVGVEFPEDIGAGSLDGAGKEGQCLYIPTESVKAKE